MIAAHPGRNRATRQEARTKMSKIRVIPIASVAALATALALPALAQQLSEQKARQVADEIEQARYKAFQAKDVAAAASLQTEDGIRVTGAGATLIGREANEKWLVKILPNYDADLSKVDQVKVLSNDVIVVTGYWSGVWHGESGPVHETGRWANTDVRVGDTWKIAVSMVSDTTQK
jgi:uncharacterized protein (TIGR02246 family)